MSAPKVSEVRNRFEKFGGQVRTPVVKKLSSPFLAGAATPASGVGGGSEMEKACKDAQDLAKELQKQVAELDKTRSKERQEFSSEVEKVRREVKAELEDYRSRNAMVTATISFPPGKYLVYR